MKRLFSLVAVLLLLPSLLWAQSAVLGPAANPVQPVVVLLTGAIPFIKASSGTMGNNGAVSAMTALPRTFSGGAYLYLPANAISAGSAAGWYWFVASSTTAGTVYNCTYTSGTPRICTATAFSTTGPGAFTGDTGTITSVSITIPGGLMGPSGRIEAQMTGSNNNSAGAKTRKMKYGGTDCFTRGETTSISGVGQCFVSNRSNNAIQSLSFFNISSGGSGVGVIETADGAINSAVNQSFAFTSITAAATDHNILEGYRVAVYPGQ